MNTTLQFIIGIFLAIELANYTSFKKYLSEKECEKYLNLDPTTLRINRLDNSILSFGKFGGDLIYHIPFPILGKYYIFGVGIVPRWSKLHKKIKEYYQIAKNNSNGKK